MTIRIDRLANGMAVVTDAMDTVESATVGVWVQSGTRHETAAVNGISHLLEHMAFKGTKRRSARAIAEEIEAVGGHLNAYTARESTAYYAKVLKGDVDLALDLVADILQASVFDPEELAKERGVVLQEIGQARDTPDDIVFDWFQETAFPDQPLGWSVLGREDTVSAIDRPALFQHLAGHYRAPGMVLAAAGRIDHRGMVEAAERLFGGLAAEPAAAPVPARYVGGDFRREDDLEQVHLVLGLPGLPLGHADQYALAAFSTLLGGGASSRLFQEVREKRGLVYSVYSFHAAFADSGLFGLYAGTGADKVSELVPVVFDTLAETARRIEPAELARAKAQIKADLLMALESTHARAEQAARQYALYGRVLALDEMVAAVEAVDEGACRRVAARLVAGPLTVAATGPVAALESRDAMARRLGG
jgi:predicted Zn-dependent peptidase